MLSFLKKIFGDNEESNKPKPSSNPHVQVPESVLDRFILNCPEFYYSKPGASDKIVFLMKGKEAKIGNDPMTAGISIMALMWLRTIYKTNNALFMSIVKNHQKEISVSDAVMKEFLWSYYRTGNSANQPQLSVFYKRGTGIVSFIDSVIPYSHLVFDEQNSESLCDYVNSKYGETPNISDTIKISAEDFAKIIIRDMHSGELSDKEPTSEVREPSLMENPETVKHVRPKVPRQQKQQKGIKPIVGQSNVAYLLIFSASWCGPSKRFVKEIEEAGIKCYTYIDVDEDWTEQLVVKYGVRNIPLTVLVDTHGEIINKWVGYDDEDPGQTKFVSYINKCNYNIIPFNGKSL